MSPSPDPDQIRALERRMFRAWPALETLEDGGWVQRFAGGYTKRANSINALGPEVQYTSEIHRSLEEPYRTRGLPPVWRLTPLAPAGTEPALAQLGYRRIDHALVQVAPLDGRFRADPEVRIEAAPSPDWLAQFAEHSPVAPAHREAMTGMLTSIAAPVGFAQVELSGRFAGFAIGVVDGDHVGLFDVLVTAAARRQGLARRITQSIGAWGRSHGARFMYLQVVATNIAALPLYASLGFTSVYSYAYRVPPAA